MGKVVCLSSALFCGPQDSGINVVDLYLIVYLVQLKIVRFLWSTFYAVHSILFPTYLNIQPLLSGPRNSLAAGPGIALPAVM